MPLINILGVGPARFPDEMPLEEIRAFLREKYKPDQDHGLQDARRQEQLRNIEPITSSVSDYVSGVGERVKRFTEDPLEELGRGFFEKTMGLDLDQPAEKILSPVGPGSELTGEVASWIPGPMGALGTIARKGVKDNIRVLYHGSNMELKNIDDSGLFGGIFAGGKDTALSHGEKLHKIEIPENKILTQQAIDYDLPYEKVIDDLQENLHWLTRDEVEEVAEAAIYKDDSFSDRMAELLKVDDAAEASWEGQRLRGIVAKKEGYSAVDMIDEHGVTTLVLPGNKITR